MYLVIDRICYSRYAKIYNKIIHTCLNGDILLKKFKIDRFHATTLKLFCAVLIIEYKAYHQHTTFFLLLALQPH